MRTLLRLILPLLIPVSELSAQTSHRSGEIIYNVSYSSDKYKADDFNSLPTVITYRFQDDRIRMEFPINDEYKLTTIVDCDKKKVIILKDIAGKKYYKRVSKRKALKKQSGKGSYKFNTAQDCGELVGLNCLSTSDPLNNIMVKYTTDILIKDPNWNTQYSNIEGFLLEFSTHTPDYSIHYHAGTITSKEFPESYFEIPAQYEKMKKDQSGK